MLFIGVGLIGFLGYFLLHRHMALSSRWTGPTTGDPFILAIAYDQIVENEDGEHVSRSQLESHLQMLKNEGFFAVGLQDLWSFYYEQKPLPPKAVLLTFNNGYFSTYTVVDPLLRSMGWHGVITINTKVLAKRSTSKLYWDRLSRMIKNGIWDIVSSGHNSLESIYISPQKEEGRFLTHRQWLENKKRLETYAEYTDRVFEDHQVSKDIFSKHLPGLNLIAYAAPWGRMGRLIDDKQLLILNQKAVKRHYSIAFVDDYFGFNNRCTDPYHIKRLAVNPGWSDKKLFAHIRNLQQMPTVSGAETDNTGLRWHVGVGQVERHANQVVLKGEPRADIWIPGGEKAENWMITADIQLDQGEFWLVQQAVDDPKRLWRVGGDERGIFVQHRDWQQFETLASFPTPIEVGGTHHLKVIKRGRGLWIELDNRRLTETPVYLNDRWRGPIGWVAWNRDGPAQLRLTLQHHALWPTRVSMLNNTPSEAEVQKTIAEAVYIDAIAVPEWVIRGDRFEALEIDSNLLALLSRRYCWDLIPMISVDPDQLGADSDLFAGGRKEWLKLVRNKPWKYLLIDLRQFDQERLKRMEPILRQLKNDLNSIQISLLFSIADDATLDKGLTAPANIRDCRPVWNTVHILSPLQ
jgi:peptidoglycan/xylan/chitin deacetylase (PgdA/CDA1 family)